MDITAVDALVSIVMLLLVALGFGMLADHVHDTTTSGYLNMVAMALLGIAAIITIVFIGMLMF